MSTHNIGFYEDLTKIIFELSSNIIIYAPYFFCWLCLFVFLDFSHVVSRAGLCQFLIIAYHFTLHIIATFNIVLTFKLQASEL